MSGHGHVTPNPDGSKARCGGPAICPVCRAEDALVGEPLASPSQPAPEPSEANGERIAANAALLRLFKGEYENSGDRHSDALVAREWAEALLAERDELRRSVAEAENRVKIAQSARDHAFEFVRKKADDSMFRFCEMEAALTAERTLREANEKLVGKLREALEQLEPSLRYRSDMSPIIAGRALKLTPADFLPPATLGGDEKMKRDGPSELAAKLTEAPKGPTPAAPQPPATQAEQKKP